MAVKQRFNLDETMLDAKKSIEEAQKTAMADPAQQPSAPDAPVTADPVPSVQPQEAAPMPGNKQGRPKKKPTSADTDRTERRTVRNVSLDEETLWRLQAVKQRLNKSRGEGDRFYTLDQIIYDAVIEHLDKHYAETKEAYRYFNDL